jgi:DNA-binding PadR family transcriptional regulator
MTKTTHPRELEHSILLAIQRLGENAYGLSIRDELESQEGHKVTAGTMYVSLERLVTMGYLGAWMGDPSAVRGGKAKRYFRLTEAARGSLMDSSPDTSEEALTGQGGGTMLKRLSVS